MSKKNKSFGNYDNGIPKRLCTNCPYKKVSFGKDSWCKLYTKVMVCWESTNGMISLTLNVLWLL